MLGKISVQRFNETSYNGFDTSILKSGIQKYCRRNMKDKGLWCLIEMDLFYLTENKHQFDKKIYTNAKRIRTNMINRLIVMISEEISIANVSLPYLMLNLYEEWQDKRNDAKQNYGRETLFKMYHLLLESKKIRIISDLRSIYLLPSYYVDKQHMNILINKHQKIVKEYDRLYDRLYGKRYLNLDLNKFLELCEKTLNDKNEDIFIILRDVFLSKNDKESKYFMDKLWNLLNQLAKKISDDIYLDIKSLNIIYKKMTHKEKFIYLYHAILLVIKHNDLISNYKDNCNIINNFYDINELYQDHINHKKIEIDDFIEDIHTKKKNELINHNGHLKFAKEGAIVVNQDDRFLNKEYREIYIKLKEIIDKTDFKTLCKNKSQIEKQENKIENANQELYRGLIIKKIDNLNYFNKMPHGQKKTSKFKKVVFVDKDITIKGPYKKTELSFLNNLRYTLAFDYLENLLKIDEKYRSVLLWHEIWYYEDEYYLVTKNVGNPKAIEFEIVSSKLEIDVPVIKRGSFIQRFSEIEDEIMDEDYLIAVLQHLYIRFLLGIGDSGTHNILVREDNSERLIVGNDFEERRSNINPKNIWECLFRKVFKKYSNIYQNYLKDIKILGIEDCTEEVDEEMIKLGIDNIMIKNNIKKWIECYQQ